MYIYIYIYIYHNFCTISSCDSTHWTHFVVVYLQEYDEHLSRLEACVLKSLSSQLNVISVVAKNGDRLAG
jgi:hypothetical protein